MILHFWLWHYEYWMLMCFITASLKLRPADITDTQGGWRRSEVLLWHRQVSVKEQAASYLEGPLTAPEEYGSFNNTLSACLYCSWYHLSYSGACVQPPPNITPPPHSYYQHNLQLSSSFSAQMLHEQCQHLRLTATSLVCSERSFHNISKTISICLTTDVMNTKIPNEPVNEWPSQ